MTELGLVCCAVVVLAFLFAPEFLRWRRERYERRRKGFRVIS